ncbi:MAG: MoaD/ThiS family protein [Pyrinomonadaceae bacterium]
MLIRLLFFGATADAVGSRELAFKIDENTIAGTLIAHIIQQHPSLASHKLLIAVNEQYADADTILSDGDTVAVFTAVSGG